MNTAILPDELGALGLDVLIFSENLKSRNGLRTYPQKLLLQDMDSSWEASMETLYEQKLKQYLESGIDHPKHRQYRQEFLEIKEQLQNSPSQMRQLVNSADIVIARPEYLDILKQLEPDALIAVLEDISTNPPLMQKGTGLPRILVNDTKEQQTRIDSQTLDLLLQKDFDEILSMSQIDYRLMLGLKSDSAYINPVERSKVRIRHPVRKRPFNELDFDLDENIPEQTVEVVANNYTLGGLYNGLSWGGTTPRFLERLREKKLESVREFYQELWKKPLDTIKLAKDRQLLLAEIVENEAHMKDMDTLDTAINKMQEPYLHISRMANNISTNILHSKWGARINKQLFYCDFVKISKEFVQWYEKAKGALASITTESREMQVILEPLRLFLEEDSDLEETYKFLSGMDNICSYEKLHSYFGKALTDARLIPELEEAKLGGGDAYGVPDWKTRSDYLEALLQAFNSQNPVSRSQDVMKYLDFAGTRLAGYNALANYIIRHNWARPEILPGESGTVHIEGGWYPLTDGFPIPNDTYLDNESRIEIIDGTNAGGKTVDEKKTLFITHLVMTGNYVPAKKAEVSFLDRVMFRLKPQGMYDSSALVDELRNIGSGLESADSHVLLGFDETWTSTNAREGEALTYALIRYISEHPKARAIITSHYPSLHDILEDQNAPDIKFSHFIFRMTDGKIRFDHRKQPGPNTMGDYALVIAEHEGVPAQILEYAKEYTKND